MTVAGTADGWLLVDALEAECRLLAELISILRQQWTALAADNGLAVDDCMFAGRRILDTLRTAQCRKQSLVEQLTGDPLTSLARVDGALSGDQSQIVLGLRKQIGAQAIVLADEIRHNRRVLQARPRGAAELARTVHGAGKAGGVAA